MEHVIDPAWVRTAVEIVALIGTAVAGYYALRAEIRIVKHDHGTLKQRQQVIDDTLAAIQRNIDSDVERVRRETGEVASSLRQALWDTREELKKIELYIRDNFIRKETFTVVLGKVESDIKAMESKIDAWMIRMETKLDGLKGA